MSEESKKQMTPEQKINHLGSFPPMTQFFGVLIGLIIDYFYPVRLLMPNTAMLIGFIFILFSTVVIVWSQKTSAKFHRHRKQGLGHNFLMGPYKFSSNPTSFGLALLTIGFGFILNSIILVGISAIAYWFSYLVYGSKKEKIMEELYKEDYKAYKNKIKL